MTELSATDQASIKALFQSYSEAWARRDSAACAAFFAHDGDLLAVDGELCTSPSEIEKYYARQLFGPYKDLVIRDVVASPPRSLSTNLAMVDMAWRIAGLKSAAGAALEPIKARGSFFMRKESEGWRYVAVRLMVPFAMPL